VAHRRSHYEQPRSSAACRCHNEEQREAVTREDRAADGEKVSRAEKRQ
jgi:hypothetical protein